MDASSSLNLGACITCFNVLLRSDVNIVVMEMPLYRLGQSSCAFGMAHGLMVELYIEGQQLGC